MADTGDFPGLGSELKFLVAAAAAGPLRAWARANLAPDPHGGGPFQDEYHTETLYFETPAFDVFRRQGSYGRSKYRIRRYEAGALVFIERKMRSADRLAKRRTAMPMDALAGLRLTNGVAPGESPHQAGPATWFERRVAARRLKPICGVSYRRLARVGETADGLVRLTIDDDMRARPATSLAFPEGRGTPFLDGHVVVEVKHRGRLPALLRRFVEDFNLTPRRASKYRSAVEVLGLAPAGLQPGTLDHSHA